jgi:S-adenosylmethionine/arginine decarboxylase-like enzyme
MNHSSGITTMVNAYTKGEPSFLIDFFYIKNTLYDLADVIGMTVLKDVSVVVPPDPEKKDTGEDHGGISVSLIISTSSIHIHTWYDGFFRLVVDSCKSYDTEKLKEFIEERLYVEKATYDIRPYLL